MENAERLSESLPSPEPTDPVVCLELVPVDARPSDRLVSVFLAGRSPRTIQAYREDLQGFAAYLGASTVEDAARSLTARSQGEANQLAHEYRASLMDRGLSASTVNRRLTALRSLVKLARTIGLVPWTLDVPNLDSQPYRDTRGPGIDGVRKLLGAAVTGRHPTRDVCLIRLLFDLALRRAEVCSLTMADVDIDGGRLSVLGKGRRAKETITMQPKTLAAVAALVVERGSEPGPLFLNHDHASKTGRLSGTSLYRIVVELGAKAGIKVRPHGLRHSGITAALDATNGNIRSVQKFSRHRDVRVLSIYDDSRQDLAGEVSALVSNLV